MRELTGDELKKIADEVEQACADLLTLFENRNAGAFICALGIVIGQLAPDKEMLDSAIKSIKFNANTRFNSLHEYHQGVTLQ